MMRMGKQTVATMRLWMKEFVQLVSFFFQSNWVEFWDLFQAYDFSLSISICSTVTKNNGGASSCRILRYFITNPNWLFVVESCMIYFPHYSLYFVSIFLHRFEFLFIWPLNSVWFFCWFCPILCTHTVAQRGHHQDYYSKQTDLQRSLPNPCEPYML